MRVSMCESCCYKYKVLMMAVKQLKEGMEDKPAAPEEEGMELFCK